MVATHRRTTPPHPVVVDGTTVHRRRCRGGFARDDGGERVTRRHDRDWRTADPAHAIWSSSEPVGRTDYPPASPVDGRRRLLARPGAHAPSTTEHATAGTPDTTDCPIWSSGESTERAGGPPASPVGRRRRLLARPGTPAILPARRTSTTPGDTDHLTLGRSQANPRPSVPAEWSVRESAGRAASQRAEPVRGCRWGATSLYAPADRGCLLRAGRSTTATDRVVRERVTISTRTGGGAA